MLKRLFGKDENDSAKSDQKILEEVTWRIRNDQYLGEHPIEVSVVDGIVTLKGKVVAPLQKNLASEIASEVAGVIDVQNELGLGIGKPGDNLVEQNLPADDVSLSEGSNTGVPNLHHPSTTTLNEVTPSTPEGVTGGIDTGVTAFESMQSVIPSTGEGIQGSSVMDAGAVDAMRVSGEEVGDDDLANVISEGTSVVDREGKKVGTVKTVRTTDFHLHRDLLSRDVYVPYFVCTYDGENVIINVLASEIGDQGWAHPGTPVI
jgi:hypothetical protein